MKPALLYVQSALQARVEAAQLVSSIPLKIQESVNVTQTSIKVDRHVSPVILSVMDAQLLVILPVILVQLINFKC